MLNATLLPLSAIFATAVAVRKHGYRIGVLKSARVSVPVLVAGNIVVGGGGKTPLTIALALALQKRGYTPGVATRGSGGNYHGVLRVNEKTPWQQCGDEPLLIYKRTGAAVCACQNRVLAAQTLAADGCDVIICDDGMQHYALRRDVEICVVNADFGLGNGWLLPAGPLREGVRRLDKCDFIVAAGEGDFAHPRAMSAALQTDGFYALADEQTPKAVADFANKRIAALAAIAAPRRFFDSLYTVGIFPHEEYALPDHGRMEDKQLAALEADIILMSEKDAIKYSPDDKRLHAMRMSMHLPPRLVDMICDRF